MDPVHISEALPAPFTGKPRQPQTIDDLIRRFEELEALDNEDAVVPTKCLRLTTETTLAVDALHGSFAFTDWSKKQLSQMVGVQWDRWFARMTPEDQATEINKRLWSHTGQLRIRTSRVASNANGAAGTLRAIVSPVFTPLPNSAVARLLALALKRVEPDLRVTRCELTDKSATYVLGVGKPLRPESSEVGDLWGTITMVNSDVGFRSAAAWASLIRLVCKNGLVLPVPGSLLFRRAHRRFDFGKLAAELAERLSDFPGKLQRAARVLDEARRVRITDARAVFTTILEAARVSLKLLPEVESAYAAEPALDASAFAVSQAITRAAQSIEPEQRFELERAAGQYLSNLIGDVE